MKPLLFPLLLATIAAADTVVLRDRSIVEGKVLKSDKALAVGDKSVPLGEVLLWEDDKGLALYAPSFDAQVEGCRALAVRDRLLECRKVFPEMVAAGAADAARATLELAMLSGLPAKEGAAWDAQVSKVTRKEGAPGAAPSSTKVFAELLFRRAKAEMDAGEGHEYRGWQLLRESLLVQGDHAAALELLASIAPQNFPIGQSGEKLPPPAVARRLWLDWNVDVLRGEVRPLGRRAPDMERARTIWRKDLNGVETREEGSEIVFITPINDRTEVLGKCVRYARITCRALAKMFATDKPRRDDNEPLVIYFFESRNEYLKENPGNPMLAMTLGFYAASDNVSRFFWPDSLDATREVRRVFVHELTHHWIERRNPRWHASDLVEGQARWRNPGYWVVEGFATFIEEGSYDIDTFKWSHFSPHASSLSVVAALSREKEKKIIDWDVLFTLTQVEAQGAKLSKEGVKAVANKKWGITPQPFGEMRLFYEQSAAACHFLYWGEDGKYRAKLLDYVTSHYTGKANQCAIEAAFGLQPAELGKKVEEFACKVMDGWRPAKP